MVGFWIEVFNKSVSRNTIPSDRMFAAKINDLREAMLFGPVGDEHFVDATSVGTKGFENRKNTKDQGGSIFWFRVFRLWPLVFGSRSGTGIAKLFLHNRCHCRREYFVN